MAKSLNSKIDLIIKATSYLKLGEYGKIMIGDKAFEFYNDHNINDFIQIPWQEINLIIASIMFKGKWIPRYAIQTKHNGTFSFSSRNPKKVLRVIHKYVDSNHMVRSLTFFQVLKRDLKFLLNKTKKYLKQNKKSKK